MEFFSFDDGSLPASVNISRFRGPDGVDEIHLVARPTAYGTIETQLNCVDRAYREALQSIGLTMQTAILRRFFLSDLPNQARALEAFPFANPRQADEPCAVSWVCQPPAPPAKVALWAYHIHDPRAKLDKTREGSSLALNRGELAHHWTTGIVSANGDTSYRQTRGLFERYDAFLRDRGLTLAEHVIRTWLFVQDIDANYQGMVAARREFFAEHGLTPETHYIASSGIEGAQARADVKVAMDAYAISGVRPEQISYLEALDHLSPTQLYGVTFERGVAVAYRDRRHVILSGTASIDREGKILYPGDVARQLDRTLENMEALLKQVGAALGDMCVFIVYVRDPCDLDAARRQMRERFGDAPIEVIVAPVCRPGWLIEVEGKAIIPESNPGLPAF